MRRIVLSLLLVTGLISAYSPIPVAADLQPKGTLVIAGGGDLPASVFAAFVAAAGGKGAAVTVVPLASSDQPGAAANASHNLTAAGAAVTVLSYAKRAEADTPAHQGQLQRSRGIWFTGGDQNLIGDLFVGTALHQILKQRYANGAVIGGTSAGAAAMSQIMLTGDGDTTSSLPGTFKTRAGLGLLPGCIVDQHFLRRQRQNRLLSLIEEHPDHLGFGIDEETALLVSGTTAKVIGNRRVMVIDPQHANRRQGGIIGLQVHLLNPGQWLNLVTRQVGDDQPAASRQKAS